MLSWTREWESLHKKGLIKKGLSHFSYYKLIVEMSYYVMVWVALGWGVKEGFFNESVSGFIY